MVAEPTVVDYESPGDLDSTYSISSYGADYPIDGLVLRLQNQTIYTPSFQRGFVWTHQQASRFIESLLLGLPVPGVFFSREPVTQKLLIIDGQQRLRTVQYFYEGHFPGTDRVFALTNSRSRFNRKTYRTLDEEDRRRLDDTIIHATIIKQERPAEDDSSIYHVFERLNTGGTQLLSQEIRAAIYHGPFDDALAILNQNEAWRSVYGSPTARLRDEELILRFLAMLFWRRHYKVGLKSFLNEFMAKNRHLEIHSQSQLEAAFVPAIEIVHATLGGEAFRPSRTLNAAVFDAVMVGLATRLVREPITDIGQVVGQYRQLLSNRRFIDATETGTAHPDSVATRMSLAIEAFSEID